MEKRYSEKEVEFFHDWIFPEEDRHLYTTAKWDGSFRWFKTVNVVCFEHYRRQAPLLHPATAA